MGRHKKVNGVGCLHCAWVDAIHKKYPKYQDKINSKKDYKIADEIMQSAVYIAARAMSSLNEEGKEKFLAGIATETARVEGRNNRLRPILEAVIKSTIGAESKIMNFDELKAMLESFGQTKN